MAAISITATQVQDVPGNGDVYEEAEIATGQTVTAGAAVKLDADGRWRLLDADDVGYTSDVFGVAIGGGSAGQRIVAKRGGDVDLGAGAAVACGAALIGHTTAGSLTVTPADVGSGKYLYHFGYGCGSNRARLRCYCPGVAVA